MTQPNQQEPPPPVNGIPDGKLPHALREWEERTFDRAAFLAGLREVGQSGGVELKDFLHQLEEATRD